MVVFDTNYLMYLLQDEPSPVTHPETKELVENAKGKVEHLIAGLNAGRTQILIPTPVLAEVCVKFGARTNDILRILKDNLRFQFAPFDTRAAFECGMMLHSAIQQGDKSVHKRQAGVEVVEGFGYARSSCVGFRRSTSRANIDGTFR